MNRCRNHVQISAMIRAMIEATHAIPPVKKTARQWADVFGVGTNDIRRAKSRAPAVAAAIVKGYEEAPLVTEVNVTSRGEFRMATVRGRVLRAAGVEFHEKLRCTVDPARRQIILTPIEPETPGQV